MSALGQKLTFSLQPALSAACHKQKSRAGHPARAIDRREHRLQRAGPKAKSEPVYVKSEWERELELALEGSICEQTCATITG